MAYAFQHRRAGSGSLSFLLLPQLPMVAVSRGLAFGLRVYQLSITLASGRGQRIILPASRGGGMCHSASSPA